MANKVLNESLSVPLDGATTAKVEIHSGTGNLTIGRLAAGEPALASGSLQRLEKQEPPMRTLDVSGGQATLTLKAAKDGGRRSWFRPPWQACWGGAYEWQVRLNPGVPCDITAQSDGGDLRLDLAGMVITRVSAGTGGGNVEMVLPDRAANLSVAAETGAGNVSIDIGSGSTGSHTVSARSGAGNVTVSVPGGMAVRVRATSGLGKVIVDPRLAQVDGHTYQSPDYDGATDRVEITAGSGAGNVSVVSS